MIYPPNLQRTSRTRDKPLVVKVPNTSEINCSGIILAGGMNKRMHGRNKALIKLHHRRFLDHILGTLHECFSRCLIVTREPSVYVEWDAKIVSDRFDVRSPLTGIHAGLISMDSGYAFVTSCDAPLLKKEVIDILVEAIEPGIDVITPASGGYYQPMCAIYSARCAGIIEQMLHRRELKVDLLYERIRLKTIPYARFEAVDPRLTSFFNVNTPEDLKKAREMYGGKFDP